MNIDDDLGLMSAPTLEPTPLHEFNSKIAVELVVPEVPSVKDLATAFREKVEAELFVAEAEILDAELTVANAQRIANALREKVARLKAQVGGLNEQIQRL